jgi:putative spermidine/putrescine transport system permease protein
MLAPVTKPAARRGLNMVALCGVSLLRCAAFCVLLLPVLLVVFLSFSNDNYTIIPPTGYSFRWYANIAEQQDLLDGLVTSLKIAGIVAPTALVVGTLAAFAQWRYRVLSRETLELLISIPIMVPSVVTGMALLILFSDLQMYSGFWNIVLAHLILCLPFATRPVILMLARCDRQLDQAAATLGAGAFETFWHVVLPQIRSGLLAGAIFAFIASFDDFPIAIFLIDADTVPLPVAMYHYMQWNLDPTLSAFSALLVLSAVVCAMAIDRLVGIGRFFGIDD